MTKRLQKKSQRVEVSTEREDVTANPTTKDRGKEAICLLRT